MTPVSRVLVVSADSAWLARVVSGLSEAAALLDNPLGLTVVAAADADSAMAAVLADGEIQIVLIDHGGRDEAQGAGPQHASTPRSPAAVRAAQALIHQRPELSLYMTLEDDADKMLVETLTARTARCD